MRRRRRGPTRSFGTQPVPVTFRFPASAGERRRGLEVVEHAARGYAGQTLLDIAVREGVPLTDECGGAGTCATCQIYVLCGGDALEEMDDAEREALASAPQRRPESRLACRSTITGNTPITAELPSDKSA